MKMHNIEIRKIDGEIQIIQEDEHDASIIIITIDQAKTVADWIIESAKEIAEGEAL